MRLTASGPAGDRGPASTPAGGKGAMCLPSRGHGRCWGCRHERGARSPAVPSGPPGAGRVEVDRGRLEVEALHRTCSARGSRARRLGAGPARIGRNS